MPRKRLKMRAAAEAAVAKNIRTICEVEEESMSRRSIGERWGDLVARTAGRAWFSAAHAVWFGTWIVLNRGLVRSVRPFDPYPFPFLTFVVSLEAIFLSLFILMSQNRAGRQADQRAHLDLQINLLSELEATKALQMLQALCRKHGLPEANDKEVTQLVRKTEPKVVVEELNSSLPTG